MIRLALLGYPLAHSLSPQMQNAALAAVGLGDWRYEATPVEPGRLAEAVARVRGPEYAGANVTIPHKQAVIPLLDGLTPVAAAIGAVNTLFKPGGPLPGAGGEGRPDGPLVGHNTDAAGLLADLYAHGVRLEGRTVLILGAGGAALAAAAACAGFGARLRLIARRPPAQTSRAAQTSQVFETCEVFPWTLLGFLQASDGCSLVINATPVGMAAPPPSGVGGDIPWPEDVPLPAGAFVYDMIYSPPETALIRLARAAGLRAANGLGMLVEQGALAFELWTGHAAPRDLMRRTLAAHLSPSARHSSPRP